MPSRAKWVDTTIRLREYYNKAVYLQFRIGCRGSLADFKFRLFVYAYNAAAKCGNTEL